MLNSEQSFNGFTFMLNASGMLSPHTAQPQIPGTVTVGYLSPQYSLTLYPACFATFFEGL